MATLAKREAFTRYYKSNSLLVKETDIKRKRLIQVLTASAKQTIWLFDEDGFFTSFRRTLLPKEYHSNRVLQGNTWRKHVNIKDPKEQTTKKGLKLYFFWQFCLTFHGLSFVLHAGSAKSLGATRSSQCRTFDCNSGDFFVFVKRVSPLMRSAAFPSRKAILSLGSWLKMFPSAHDSRVIEIQCLKTGLY